MAEVCFVSACLVGVNCRFDGEHRCAPGVIESLRNMRVVYECPESLGGLPTPRCPSYIDRGDGADVLAGRSHVLNAAGEDVTRRFLKGARATLAMVKRGGITRAILKSKSPSCGSGTIRRHSRHARGWGVTAALLRDHGIEVVEV